MVLGEPISSFLISHCQVWSTNLHTLKNLVSHKFLCLRNTDVQIKMVHNTNTHIQIGIQSCPLWHSHGKLSKSSCSEPTKWPKHLWNQLMLVQEATEDPSHLQSPEIKWEKKFFLIMRNLKNTFEKSKQMSTHAHWRHSYWQGHLSPSQG